MKRKYGKTGLNLTETLDALRAGGAIVVSKTDPGAYMTDVPDKRYSSWGVDHRAMVALHRRKLLVKVHDGLHEIKFKLATTA